ncbi:MAG: response regulator [Candidatus Krumholzibacteriia bacterium]
MSVAESRTGKGRVLLVDADPDVLTAACSALRAEGWAVVTALDAVQATRRALRESCDLVVLDLALPGGGAHAVAARLREHAQTAALPIVYLAENADTYDYERARELRVAKVLEKPVPAAVLTAALEGLVSCQVKRAQANRS